MIKDLMSPCMNFEEFGPHIIMTLFNTERNLDEIGDN